MIKTSITDPFRSPAFRWLISGSAIYHIANAMHAMAAAWLMIEMTGSSFMAALVQTAAFLPMFLLVLPAGVLSDTSDRKKVISRSLIAQVAILATLALVTATGVWVPSLMLLLIFLAGCSSAMLSPSWNRSIADSVPREDIPQAITAYAIAFNSARAIGPSFAGFLFAWLGGAAVFAIATAGTILMLQILRGSQIPAHQPSQLPAERLLGGTVAALRYARHSPLIFALLIRTAAFSGSGAALWALLPAIAVQKLKLGAEGFGLLMGCMGIGAVMSGLILGKIRAFLGLERLVTVGCALFAFVMATTLMVETPYLIFAALVLGGAAWMAVLATFNVATQTSVPPWVQSRATALHTMSAMGSFAVGSAVWGALASLIGLQPTLLLAGIVVAGGIVLARKFPIRIVASGEVTPVPTSEGLLLAQQPLPDEGPIAVELHYHIQDGNYENFLSCVSELRGSRQRDGATFWRLYRDLEDPTRCVERFIVESWAEYLRQRARGTVEDQKLETQVRQHLHPNSPVRLKLYIAER